MSFGSWCFRCAVLPGLLTLTNCSERYGKSGTLGQRRFVGEILFGLGSELSWNAWFWAGLSMFGPLRVDSLAYEKSILSRTQRSIPGPSLWCQMALRMRFVVKSCLYKDLETSLQVLKDGDSPSNRALTRACKAQPNQHGESQGQLKVKWPFSLRHLASLWRST